MVSSGNINVRTNTSEVFVYYFITFTYAGTESLEVRGASFAFFKQAVLAPGKLINPGCPIEVSRTDNQRQIGVNYT